MNLGSQFLTEGKVALLGQDTKAPGRKDSKLRYKPDAYLLPEVC